MVHHSLLRSSFLSSHSISKLWSENMGVLGIILLVLFVLVALALIFLIAIQDESSGLSGVFGGSSDSTFGSGSSKFINKVTTILAVYSFFFPPHAAFVAKSSYRSSSLLDSAASSNSTLYQDTAAQN